LNLVNNYIRDDLSLGYLEEGGQGKEDLREGGGGLEDGREEENHNTRHISHERGVGIEMVSLFHTQNYENYV